MRIMPANSTGWFWHCLARETDLIGHLYSVGYDKGRKAFVPTMREPKPWFPYAIDNGMFTTWDPEHNVIDWAKWDQIEPVWSAMIDRAMTYEQKPLWAVVPDAPGNSVLTLEQWAKHAPGLKRKGVTLALAVQNGMDDNDVLGLDIMPDVIAVGGSTDWKWDTAEAWCKSFPRVHILRCNSPAKLDLLASWGAESCDGTGWNRGDKNQTKGLEAFCRRHGQPHKGQLWPHVCREGAIKGTGQGVLI